MTTTVIPDLVRLSPAVRTVLDRLTPLGVRPLIVGGAVRDALYTRFHGGEEEEARDVDIEVFGARSYDQLASALRGVGFVDFRGRSYGVLAVNVDGQDVDISLPRRDSKVGDGHRGFTVDVDPDLSEADAFARRDFTINAIGWDPVTGAVIDHFGGVQDILDRYLVPTSGAFAEDPLRVLRGIQFIARFDLIPSQWFVDVARAIAPHFGELSVERVWGEWRKLLRRGRSIAFALRVLEDTGWLAHFPALARLRDVPQDSIWHPEGDVLTHSLLAAQEAANAAAAGGWDDDDRELVVLAALLHDVGKVSTTTVNAAGRTIAHGHDTAGADIAYQFVVDIGAPQYLAKRVATLVREHMAHASLGGQPTARAVRQLVRRLDAAAVSLADWARVVDADCAGRGEGSKPSPAGGWLAATAELGTTTARPSLLRGEHLIAAGLAPGPRFRDILAAAVEAQDAGEFDDVDGARAWLTTSGLLD